MRRGGSAEDEEEPGLDAPGGSKIETAEAMRLANEALMRPPMIALHFESDEYDPVVDARQHFHVLAEVCRLGRAGGARSPEECYRSRPDMGSPVLERFRAMTEAGLADRAQALMAEWGRLTGMAPNDGPPQPPTR